MQWTILYFLPEPDLRSLLILVKTEKIKYDINYDVTFGLL